jgi:hypothetical protein
MSNKLVPKEQKLREKKQKKKDLSDALRKNLMRRKVAEKSDSQKS